MVESRPNLAALRLAVLLKLRRWLGRPEPNAEFTPHGMAVSPSARHFVDYARAPLRLSFGSNRVSDIATWQRNARDKLAALCGYAVDREIPTVAAESARPIDGGLLRTLYLHARDGVDIPIHILTPAIPRPPLPVMLCLQGTNTGAHLSWGEARYPADLEKGRQANDIARQAASRGYMAVAIEQIGFGERAERAIVPRSAAPCVDATMHALLLGRCLIGERCTDVSSVIDWLIANQETIGIDVGRIHIMGHSAGGSTALFAAALDIRISAALSCGCIGYIRDTIGRRRDDQGQNVIPGILEWMEIDDIVGLVAPRRFATVAGEADPIWPASGARKVCESAAKIYVALGCKERLVVVDEPGGHRFRPEASWRAFSSLFH